MPVSAALLAYDNCALYSLSRTSGLLLLANRANEHMGLPHADFEWRVVAPGAKPARSGTGIRILPDEGLGAGRFDVVYVSAFYDPGAEALAAMLRQLRPASAWLKRQWADGATLVAFGSGTLLLAEAGLLDGYPATTNPSFAKVARKRYPDVLWQDGEPITESERVLCGSSASSDMSLIQRTIGRFMSPRIASRCAQFVLEHAGLPADAPQLTLFLDLFHRDPLIVKVDDWVARNLNRNLTIAKLSRSLGVSSRTLYRLIRSELSLSPAQFVAQRRFEMACKLLAQSSKSVYEIARRVGYSDGSVFSRAFRRRMGVSPAAYRARSGS